MNKQELINGWNYGCTFVPPDKEPMSSEELKLLNDLILSGDDDNITIAGAIVESKINEYSKEDEDIVQERFQRKDEDMEDLD